MEKVTVRLRRADVSASKAAGARRMLTRGKANANNGAADGDGASRLSDPSTTL
jgi:hypothetical protein